MKDEDKTKEQLINELIVLRKENSEMKEFIEFINNKRRQSEEALTITEEKYHSIFENTIVGIYQSSLKGRFIMVNPAFACIFGYDSPKELISSLESHQLYANKEDRAKCIQQVLEYGIGSFDVQVYRKDGSKGWVSNYLRVVRDRGGNIICFEGIVIDITHRKQVEKELNEYRHHLEEIVYQRTAELQTALANLQQEIAEREIAEDELRKSEERYRILFNNANDAILVHGLTRDNMPGKFIEVNDVACKSLGYTRKELLNLSPNDIKISGIEVPNILSRLITEKHAVFERVHITKEGSKIPVEISSHLFNLKGEATILSIVRDITERKHMEEELRKANSKISNILESITDAFYTMDKNWTITYMNSAAEEIVSRIIGRKNGSSVGENRWELLPLYVRTNLYYEYHKAMVGQIPISFEVISPYTKIYYEFNVYPSAEGLSVYFRDITERKKMEEKLKLSEERFYKVFNFSPAALTIHSLNSDKLIEANESCLKMHEYNRDEIIGRSALDLGIWVDMDERVKFRKEIMTKGFAYNHEIINRKKSGEIFTALLSGVVIELNGEKCVLVIKNDITELRQYQKEMARLSKLNLIGEMAAGIAHEVRNPLTTVRGFLQLLSNKKEYVQYKEYHELMLEELDRANSIITEFLSLAKDRAEHLEVRNLNSILETMYPLINADAIILGKDVKFEYGNIPDLLLNEKEIRQLILNLVRNGFEAMYNGGCLIIKTLVEGANVVLMVKDQGKGISGNVLDKIGTPFFTTRADGTGLGLAISYSIAARHNASIDFDTGPDGTTFYVRFKNKYINMS